MSAGTLHLISQDKSSYGVINSKGRLAIGHDGKPALFFKRAKAAAAHALSNRTGGCRTMNLTEAWEMVIKAAEITQRLIERGDLDEDACGIPRLTQALTKVTPRVQRMRARLDFIRAKKAGKQNRPSWATP